MSKQILIVDDEKAVRDMLSEAFVLKGYTVVCAGSSDEALAVLTPEIQVMFLDLKLPGAMGGLELCRQIRKDHPAACIYAITGHSSLFELADCRKAGFNDYFTKPTKLEMLYMAAEQAFVRVDGGKKSK
jgi:CheY-like chemotaxis protein